MAIRKPSKVPDYFNIASQMLNEYNSTNIGGYCTISPSTSSISSTPGTLFNEGLKIDLPDWVEKIEGYVPTAFGFPHRRKHIVVVKYMPRSTLDLPFIRVVFLDSSGGPAKFMPSIYKELVKENKRSILEKPYRITEEGNVTGMFGLPAREGIEQVVYDIECYYNYFKDFPNETDIELVKKLIDAKDAVKRMVKETKSEHIQSTIKSCRDEIVERQNQIAELEKKLNEIYEDAADGMNLLEEHGIQVDLEKPNLGMVDADAESWASGLAEAGIGYSLPGLSYPIAFADEASEIAYNSTKVQLTPSEREQFKKLWCEAEDLATKYSLDPITLDLPTAYAAPNTSTSYN